MVDSAGQMHSYVDLVFFWGGAGLSLGLRAVGFEVLGSWGFGMHVFQGLEDLFSESPSKL